MTAEQRIFAWLERADFDGTGCRHSQDTIARAVGCSRRTVIRATQKLADDGRIDSQLERRPGCKWPCRVYRVKHWNPNKRTGVLRVLARIREARKAECHTEGNGRRSRAQTRVARPQARALTSRCFAVEGPTTVVARPKMSERPGDEFQRLPQTDLPGLHGLLDDVLVLSTWVQRQALRWMPDSPAREDVELGWLERYLTDLERAAGMAREKVAWRRLLAEAAQERRDATSTEEEEWLNPQDLSGSSNARAASSSGRPSTL